MIPYGRQWIQEDDIKAVVDVLRSDWLTTGPVVDAFECAMADFVGGRYAVAVSSGTAALHAAAHAAGIVPGDEVLMPPMTFVSTANAVVFQGGVPVFIDVEADTLLMDAKKVESKITPRTKAIIAVDYAGQPCDYDALRDIARRHNLFLIADACHSLGAEYKGRKCGALANLTAFSFHPVKPITTGEGGMIVTDNRDFAGKMRRFRNHGINADHHQRSARGTWHYEMTELGYNYRITDFQCALGLSQMRRLPEWTRRRQGIARRYDDAFAKMPSVKPLLKRKDVSHAYHLYAIQITPEQTQATREKMFKALREKGIGVNVHYMPVHLHPYYKEKFGCKRGDCPEAENAYERLISLPMFPGMSDENIQDVIEAVRSVVHDADLQVK